jgi:hypothetical protein
MTSKDIVGLILVGCLTLVLLIISIILLRGKGAGLIAGYNTAKDKDRYDAVSLCKFVGKILLPIALLTPSIAISGIFHIHWLSIAYIVLVIGLIIFAAVYANTNNRFRKW